MNMLGKKPHQAAAATRIMFLPHGSNWGHSSVCLKTQLVVAVWALDTRKQIWPMSGSKCQRCVWSIHDKVLEFCWDKSLVHLLVPTSW